MVPLVPSGRRRARPFAALGLITSLVFLSSSPRASQAPTPEDATTFIARAEETLNTLGVRAERACWVQSTYITPDTQAIAAEARQAYIAAVTRFAKEAAAFRGLTLPAEQARKLLLLRLQLTMPAPADPAELAELTRVASSLESRLRQGRVLPRREEREAGMPGHHRDRADHGARAAIRESSRICGSAGAASRRRCGRGMPGWWS